MALARALVRRPKVLLLDEPLGALDKRLRESMQIELRALQKSVGITFVFVTHDQEEALSMSDRIAVMSAGKVLQIAEPRTLYEAPNCREVADFIGTMNFFDGKVTGFEGENVVIDAGPIGDVAGHRCGGQWGVCAAGWCEGHRRSAAGGENCAWRSAGRQRQFGEGHRRSERLSRRAEPFQM